MSTTIGGFYAVYISGKHGQGLVLVALRGGRIVGADAAGSIIDGQYSEPLSNSLSITLSVKAPANMPLIQGGTTGPDGETTHMNFQIPIDFATRKFVRIEGPRGPVNARFLKLRGFDE